MLLAIGPKTVFPPFHINIGRGGKLLGWGVEQASDHIVIGLGLGLGLG